MLAPLQEHIFSATENSDPVLIPFEAWHLDWIANHNADGELSQANRELYQRAAREYEMNGVGYTGVIDGAIIGSAGIVELWKGVAEAWCYVSDLSHKKIWFCKTVRRAIEEIVREKEVRRLQAVVLKDFEQSRKWLKLLGFEEESEMALYGPAGETFIRVVRFFKPVVSRVKP